MDELKLSVQNVSKTFRIRETEKCPASTLQVLKGVSFDVYRSEVVSIIGESGCGKTTLLRIIQGLIQRDAGDIEVDGKRVTASGRDRGFVFQHSNLPAWRTALANVTFGLEIAGLSKKERNQKAEQLLELVGLSHAAGLYPHELSGGMQQRVNLARALAIDPAILLMDEPFSALDAQTREVMQTELLRIQDQTKMTVLFVTHDLDEAIYLSTRIVVMGAKPGRIKKIFDVPFPRKRPKLPELRADPDFQKLRSQIWDLIGDAPVNAAAA